MARPVTSTEIQHTFSDDTVGTKCDFDMDVLHICTLITHYVIKTFVNVPVHAVVLKLYVLPEITFSKHNESGLWTNVKYIRDYDINCQHRRDKSCIYDGNDNDDYNDDNNHDGEDNTLNYTKLTLLSAYRLPQQLLQLLTQRRRLQS